MSWNALWQRVRYSIHIKSDEKDEASCQKNKDGPSHPYFFMFITVPLENIFNQQIKDRQGNQTDDHIHRRIENGLKYKEFKINQ